MLNSPIEEIKARLDIIEVISFYIKLQKAGANYKAVCPFHSDKTPSFFVSPSKQIWKCFGCGRGGSLFDFVMEIEGMEFGDALKILAQRAGVELKPIRKEIKTERQRLYQICEWASKFFQKQLEASSKGKKAKEYLLKRGISEESVKQWRLGWAPDTWHALFRFLIFRGYNRAEMEKAGLVIQNEQGKYYDRFRGRIMFPIFDINHQVVGFGGRIFEEKAGETGEKKEGSVAKYINTPNTLIYDKSRILYGLDRARVEIRKKDCCILVEGYVDVILSSQNGVGNIAAVSGTALTPHHLRFLKRYSERLILAFDMDVAGDFATKKGIDLAQESGFDIKIAILPEGKDPADVISENPGRWQETISKSQSILDFYFENTFSKFDRRTADGKREISKVLLPVIKIIPNKIVQTHWIQNLAKELSVKEETIVEEIKKLPASPPLSPYVVKEKEETKTSPSPKTRKELLEERLIKLILKNANLQRLIPEEDLRSLSSETNQLILCLRGKRISKVEDLEQFLSPECFKRIQLLSFETEVEEEGQKESDLEAELKKCLKEFKNLGTREHLRRISKDLKEAEENKDFQKADVLTKEFNETAKNLTD